MTKLLCGLAAAAALTLASQAMAADGQAVYNQDCALCHNNLAPKIGDKAAWAPRIKDGMDALDDAVIKGKGSMPPRAGKNVSDDDIKAAVQYIVSKSQ